MYLCELTLKFKNLVTSTQTDIPIKLTVYDSKTAIIEDPYDDIVNFKDSL